MFSIGNFNPMLFLLNAVITVIALTAHAFAQGWMSSKLGDPTPKMAGRLTFNPIAHLDPIGTILMLLTGFGWIKPMGINPRYYKDFKKGTTLTAIAGPIANLILAFIGLLIYAIVFILQLHIGFSDNIVYITGAIAVLFAQRNLCFLVFNLIPIPPLAGSKILGLFMSDRTYYSMLQYEHYCILLIMFLSITGAFGNIIGAGVDFFLNGIMKLLDLFVLMVA